MNCEFYENQFRLMYRILGHAGHHSQMHCQNVETKQLVARELCHGEEEAVAFARKYNGAGNVFIGRAARDRHGIAEHTRTLSLDVDPQREKDTAATDAQYDEAIQAARLIVRELNYGIVCGSGNGALVLFPLGINAPKEVAERWGRALEERAREIVKGRPVDVDSTWDIARLCKCMGTISTKGDSALWRWARFIGDPHNPGSADSFYQWLERVPQGEPVSKLPEFAVAKGELDRSKADMALAARLKLQGFSAEDTYRALLANGFRPGREDDFQRIIQKVYGGHGETRGSAPAIELVTPQSGLLGYRERNTGGQPELPTGFDAIDRATFGLVRGSIFTVGARTNCGKTSFAIGVALNLCRAGRRALFLSTETTYHEIWDRYIGAATGTSAFALQHGLKLNGHQQAVDAFIKEFQDKHQLTVYDGSRPNIDIVRRAVEQCNPDVLIFDYFQHVEGRDTKALEEFVMSIKDLAKEKNIAILMCAQLHDRLNPVNHKQFPPTLGDLKNCKMLADESRVVILLDWDRNQEDDGPAAVKVDMAKNKGPKIDVVLKLDRSIPRFENA